MLRIINIIVMVLWCGVASAQTAVGTFTSIGHGYTQNTQTEATGYLTARNQATATNTGTTSLRVGQAYSGGAFNVYRSFLAIPIDLSKRTISACTLFVNGDTDQSGTDFVLKVVAADAYKSSFNTTDASHFAGWASSGTYSITALNVDWNTSSYSADWNAIVFNAAGLTKVLSAMGDTLWIALLSNEDVTASEPIGIEYLILDSPSDTNKPYLSIEYAADVPKNAEIGSRYLWNNGDPVPIWR